MPSTLYFNGTILTMDAQNSSPEAVLTEGNRIQAVGAEADLRARMPADAHEYDLNGRTLMPAFIDPHGHFPDPGFIRLFRVDLSSPPLGDCKNMEQALDRLREKASTTPDGEWVMGVSFDNTSILESRMPTRSELDGVSQRHPIWVIHASGHNGAANSLALERRGVSRQTPDPEGGRFGRDTRTGALTGLIEGLSAMGEMGDTDFLIDRKRFWKGFDACRDEYLSHGVTYAQNAWASQTMLDHFASLPADKDPGIDIELLPVGSLEPELSADWIDANWPGNPHFTLGPRKLFTDGAFQLQTAFLSAPYFRLTDPDHPCGMVYTSQGQLDADVRKLHSKGFQIHCHCNGDAGAEMFIDAVEKTLHVHPREDHRHTIIHGQALRDDQLERMAQLGLTVSFFPAHVYYWGDRHYDTFLGPERSERISPAASAERYGVRYTIHNDASVTPTRPIHLAHCAVNRKSGSGRVLGEDQKISVLSALRAQTIDAAWQVFKEDQRGSIEPGKVADFAVLSRNPLHDPDSLTETRVLETIRNGQRVFAASHAKQKIELT
ncbi:N-substituted formamide deformylase precursor [Ruegeria denitrificans]|uniref:N-substituted formamide deformylase n=1 Tax=Ruegeria denitrificans TaxID=1715692 RepID=A0A0N7MAY0_9RHOB|nr:amidohydrolase [Ruegeria denitrificans]CUK18213.1 N-substituted formamide deformylase precursor [Ruegeria denitrificans]